MAGWWIFVPVHELLHAAGCLLGGGQVTRLEIAPLYGGALLAKIFPFVAAGGAYAGRLSGFDVAGSGWTYALTVAAPYVLTPLGFYGMARAVARSSPLLFGASTPLAFSPLLSVTGDFLELGGLALFQFWPGPGAQHRPLISDDLFRVIGELNASAIDTAVPFVVLSQALGLALALVWFRLSAATRWLTKRA